MFSFTSRARPGTCRVRYLLPIILALFLPAAILPAETNNWRHSSTVDFIEAPEIQAQNDRDSIWLAEADRLMEELHLLDVRMYTLISRVGNEESRRKLIEQRSLNRRLIYDLLSARNDVVRRVEAVRQNEEVLQLGSYN